MQRIAFVAALLTFSNAGFAASLGGVIFHGSSPFTPAELLESYASLLGEPVTSDNAQQIVEGVKALYLSRGLAPPEIEARIPQERATTLKLFIAEPTISEVRIIGRRNLRSRNDLRRIQALRDIYPVGEQSLKSAITALNANGAFFVTGQLLESQTNPNEYIASVRVAPRAWYAEVGVDNYGLERFGNEMFNGRMTALHGRYMVQARTRFASDPSLYHYASLRGRASFDRMRLQMDLSSSDASLPASSYEYTRNRIGMSASQHLVDRADLLMTAKLRVEGYEIDRVWSGFGPINEAIRSASLGLSVASARARQLHRARLSIKKGFDTLGAKTDRTATELAFQLAELAYVGQLRLATNTDFLWDVRGQISLDQLPSAERFSYGGESFGGALEPGTLSGDSGLNARVTLRRNLARVWRGWIRPFAYSDYGRVWLRADDSNVSASAAGVGVEFSNARFRAAIEFSHVLREPETSRPFKTDRLLFSLQATL